MSLADDLRMPWTVRRSVHDDDGEYVALHIDELPGFVVASADENELEQLFWEALPAFLESYLEEGETPPLPNALLSAPPQLDLTAVEVLRYQRPADLTTRYVERDARSVGIATQYAAPA
jgi:predicted RNase H-like HicB family nuclease